METAINWVFGIGSLIIGIAGSVYYGGSKITGIWIGFFGAVLLLLAAALQWQKYLSGKESANFDPARPYVAVGDAGISAQNDAAAPTVFVTIKNNGQTPARRLTWRASFTVRTYPDIGEFTLDRNTAAPENFDLQPGGTLFYQWTFTDWEKGFWEMINKGDAAIFAYGEITYEDASKTVRCTKYRLIHGGDSLVPEGKFGIAKEGNSTDDECN